MTEHSAPTSSVKIAKPTSMLSNLFSAASLKKFARALKPEEFVVNKRPRIEIPVEPVITEKEEVKEKALKKREGKKKKWDATKRIEVDALKASGEWKVILDAKHTAALASRGKDKKNLKSEVVVKEDEDEVEDDAANDNDTEKVEVEGATAVDATKDIFTVFMGNIPKSETVKTLKKYCTQFGEVESIRLRSVPVAGTAVDDSGNQKLVRRVCAIATNYSDAKGSVNAYVVFKTVEAVEAALEANNRLLGLRHLRVDRAQPTLFDPKRSVFVGSLPHYADEEDVRNHFAKALDGGHDDIEAVRLVRDPETLIGKGIGYLLFKDRDSVLKALSLHESIFKKRSLRVTICGKTSRRIKQIARGEDVSKNINYNDKSVRKNMKRDLPSSGKGGKGGHGKGGDGPDRKKFRPAYMARSENDNETDANKKNANKRINLKSTVTRNKNLVAHGQKKAIAGRKGKRLGGVVKRAMKAAAPKKK